MRVSQRPGARRAIAGRGPGSKPRAKAREGTLRVSGEGAPVVIQAWLRKPGGTGARIRRSRRCRSIAPTSAWPGPCCGGACRPPSPGSSGRPRRTRCTSTSPAPSTGRLPRRPSGRPAPRCGRLAVRRRRSTCSEAGRPASRPPHHLPPRCPRLTFRPAVHGPRPPRAATESRPLRVPIRLVRSVGQLDQRAATYTRTCTALQVAGAERCILADHRTLPLSWTRDAYWQARLLLATWARGGHDDDAAIVADHLRWLFLRCERPDGRWLRTHHADGRRAGQAFRADQQLYPLLELADFVGATGSLPELPPGPTWAELAGKAWAAAESAIDGLDRAPGDRRGRGRRAPALPLPRLRPGAALAHRDAAGRRGPAVGPRGHFLDRARGPYPCCLRRARGDRWTARDGSGPGPWTAVAASSCPSRPPTCPWRWRRCGASASPPTVPGAPPIGLRPRRREPRLRARPGRWPGLTSHAGHLDPRRHLRLGRRSGSWASRHPRRLPWRDW